VFSLSLISKEVVRRREDDGRKPNINTARYVICLLWLQKKRKLPLSSIVSMHVPIYAIYVCRSWRGVALALPSNTYSIHEMK